MIDLLTNNIEIAAIAFTFGIYAMTKLPISFWIIASVATSVIYNFA